MANSWHRCWPGRASLAHARGARKRNSDAPACGALGQPPVRRAEHDPLRTPMIHRPELVAGRFSGWSK
eukprot:7799531-Alexandrium_andersonii.AAC.1